RTARLVGVAISPLVLLATLVVIGAATPGYRPWADAFSRLGSYDEPHAVLTRAAFVVYGLLVAAGARPLGRRGAARAPRLGVLVGGWGTAGVGAGIARKDPPGTPHTAASQIHVDATVVGGALVLAAMFLAARRASDATDRRVALAACVVTAVAAVAFPFTWGSVVYGIVELVMLATASVWLAQLALRSLVADARAIRAH